VQRCTSCWVFFIRGCAILSPQILLWHKRTVILSSPSSFLSSPRSTTVTSHSRPHEKYHRSLSYYAILFLCKLCTEPLKGKRLAHSLTQVYERTSYRFAGDVSLYGWGNCWVWRPPSLRGEFGMACILRFWMDLSLQFFWLLLHSGIMPPFSLLSCLLYTYILVKNCV